MICQRCLRRLAQRSASTSSPARKPSSHPFSTSTAKHAQAVSAQITTATNPRPGDGLHPAATSTSAAQPFSAALTPSAKSLRDQFPPPTTNAAKQGGREKVLPTSIAPAGTVLKGLNFMKNAQDPIALEEGEYPEWLWGVLEKREAASGVDGAADGVGEDGDMFSKSKKQRRLAAKALRKQHLLNPELLVPKVPIHEQTIDLPGGDGTLQGAREAQQARSGLTKAMREKRRSRIKEDNFLKEMR